MADTDDKKVKELLTAATRAELERWFGLPSFEQLADERKPTAPVDPAEQALLKRRAAAIAAVDPVLLEAHRRRVEPPPDLIKFAATIELRVDPDFALLDVSRVSYIAEPREVEIPQALEDDLKQCTPQALLRDLHRVESYFQKRLEVDVPEDDRPGLRAVAEAMASRWQPPDLGILSSREGRKLLRELHDLLRQRWTELEINRPNLRVTE